MNKITAKVILLALIAVFLLPSQTNAGQRTVSSEQFTVIGESVCKFSEDVLSAEIKVSLLTNDCSDGSVPYFQPLKLTVYPKPHQIITDEKGNLQAVYKLTEPKSSFTVKQIVLIESRESVLIPADSYQALYPDRLRKYLLPSAKIEATSSPITIKARELTKGITDPYQKARKIFEFVQKHMEYDSNPGYANKGALSALRSGRGVCEDYATLMIALLRASGVPARYASGYAFSLQELEDLEMGRFAENASHGWAEFWLDGEGWVPAEPTFSLTYNGNPVVAWDNFGNLGADYNYYSVCYDNNDGYEYYYTITGGSAETDSEIEMYRGLKTIPETYEEIKLNNPLTLKVNGLLVQSDVNPLNLRGRVLVPLRTISEQFGLSAAWNTQEKQAVLMGRGIKIILREGRSEAIVNNREYILDAPPVLVSGRMMVPLRFIADALGAEAEWDGVRKLVSVRDQT